MAQQQAQVDLQEQIQVEVEVEWVFLNLLGEMVLLEL